ncbi:nitrile hydratase subunit beta [Paenibacillus abyssi]|uniref:Nitrile hydratase subunit beta n=1 Tax=Paenibacillus abyssi TaxID=1340531 RepID=A0A917CND8_9BACL|nr:nitrile hydratase subunit beta [Paenibacillus abyssi]GGF93405.1 nitrile hydratase [Paenibacillus abyssi]
MNGIHDVGGMDGFGPLQREENEPVFHACWEGRLRSILMLLNKKSRIYYVDEVRHAIERIDPVYYMGASYYQLWLLSAETLLMDKGVLTEYEIRARMDELSPDVTFEPDLVRFRQVKPCVPSSVRKSTVERSSGTESPDDPIQPKYPIGTVVKVKVMAPTGHTRVPRYIRGKEGIVEALHGNFAMPDLRVGTGINVYQPVYRVLFEARDIWGADAFPEDKLYIELWEDYLELGGAANEIG